MWSINGLTIYQLSNWSTFRSFLYEIQFSRAFDAATYFNYSETILCQVQSQLLCVFEHLSSVNCFLTKVFDSTIIAEKLNSSVLN